MQVIVVLVPSFAQVFKLVSLNRIQWLYTLSISVLPFVVVQLYKKLRELKFEKVIYMKYGKKIPGMKLPQG